MAKHIGIVANSAPGAALCYQTICTEAGKFMGMHQHPEVTLHNFSFAKYVALTSENYWEDAGDLLLESTKIVADAGAEFAICPSNTMHQLFDYVLPRSPIPWLHIAEIVAKNAKEQGFLHLGILGTRLLMEGPVYRTYLRPHGLAMTVPKADARNEINRIILEELVTGVINRKSRMYLNQTVENLKSEGCDAVVMGCTELPMIMSEVECCLPLLDSTRLLALGAVQEALRD